MQFGWGIVNPFESSDGSVEKRGHQVNLPAIVLLATAINAGCKVKRAWSTSRNGVGTTLTSHELEGLGLDGLIGVSLRNGAAHFEDKVRQESIGRRVRVLLSQ
jgi:hypothetical protein